jgi:dGTPase
MRKRTKIQRPTYRKEWQDLIDFEGNANGFQFTASRPGIEGGLRISYATLGAL